MRLILKYLNHCMLYCFKHNMSIIVRGKFSHFCNKPSIKCMFFFLLFLWRIAINLSSSCSDTKNSFKKMWPVQFHYTPKGTKESRTSRSSVQDLLLHPPCCSLHIQIWPCARSLPCIPDNFILTGDSRVFTVVRGWWIWVYCRPHVCSKPSAVWLPVVQHVPLPPEQGRLKDVIKQDLWFDMQMKTFYYYYYYFSLCWGNMEVCVCSPGGS